MLAGVLLAGCEEAEEEEVRFQDPFTAHSVSEDGIEVLWSGFTAGHQPGDPSRFELQLSNNSDDTWDGRYCLLLMDPEGIIAPLTQDDFVLEPGGARGTDLDVALPEELEENAYTLALVVRRPAGSMTQFVHIDLGQEEAVSAALPPEASETALEACPSVEGVEEDEVPALREEAEPLIEMARQDLAQRENVDPGQIELQELEAVEFPDASLGVPQEGESYAQVITPGYIIVLNAGGQTYEYHAAGERVVLAP